MADFKHDVPHATAIVFSFVLALVQFILGIYSYAGNGEYAPPFWHGTFHIYLFIFVSGRSWVVQNFQSF